MKIQCGFLAHDLLKNLIFATLAANTKNNTMLMVLQGELHDLNMLFKLNDVHIIFDGVQGIFTMVGTLCYKPVYKVYTYVTHDLNRVHMLCTGTRITP